MADSWMTTRDDSVFIICATASRLPHDPSLDDLPISNGTSASVYRWGEVAIAIAAFAWVTAERVRHLIAHFDVVQKSASRKSNIRGTRICKH